MGRSSNFNYPWHLTIADNLSSKCHILSRWAKTTPPTSELRGVTCKRAQHWSTRQHNKLCNILSQYICNWKTHLLAEWIWRQVGFPWPNSKLPLENWIQSENSIEIVYHDCTSKQHHHIFASRRQSNPNLWNQPIDSNRGHRLVPCEECQQKDFAIQGEV